MMLLFMFNLWKRHQCVSIGDECLCCTCMFMDFLFLPCHDLEALASKKKSKSKKEPKPPKQQGRTSIHPSFISPISLNLVFHFSQLYFHFVCVVNNLFINFTAEDDNDDMFKPPSLDNDEFSPFGGKSGLFSGGRGLFDDDDGVRYASPSLYQPPAFTNLPLTL